MSRFLIAALIVLLMPGALAKEPDPEKSAAKHIAQTCTHDGAFGRTFRSPGYGQIDAIADDEWDPFRRLVIDRDRSGAPQITAEASFRGYGNSYEDDAAIARHFFRALDKAITAKHRFPHREPGGRGVTFHTSNEPDSGLVFDIRQDGDRIIAVCVDLD